MSSKPQIATFWPSYKSTEGTPIVSSWSALFDRMGKPRDVADKFSLPAISFALFTDHRRAIANVLAMTGITLDIDGGVSFADACEAWGKYFAFVHTTPSATVDAPRLRVIVPTDREMTPDEFRACLRVVTATSSAAGQPPDPSTKDPSRLWFLPGRLPGGVFEARVLEGAFLRVDDLLARSAQEPKPVVAEVPRVSLIDRIERARLYLEKVDGAVSGQQGHAATFRAALNLVRGFMLSEDIAFELLLWNYNPRCSPQWSPAELRRKVQQAADKGEMPEGALLERRRA